jgi:DNA repair exonuclease SbcCD nuclease subunit
MKICLLGDTHFGVRNDSKAFHNYYEKFYKEVFFPYLEQEGVTTVLQLGDLFDRRKYINFLSLAESRRYFFDVLADKGIKLIALIGNHDIFWKESLKVNSPELLLEYYANIEIVNSPTTMQFDNKSVDIIPWICKENENEIADFITKSASDFCAGHFELSGFQMMKGIDSHEGMDRSILKSYTQVFSGHYHTRSSADNITYLGTPYELAWNDESDPKGFYILDTKDMTYEFIQNPFNMFIKYYYDDEKEDPRGIDTSVFTNKYVKLVVINKRDILKFDKFVESIYTNNPIELKIIEDFSEFEANALDESIDLEDTMTLLSDYVDNVETDSDKNRLKTLLKTLYVEAQHYNEA